MSLETQAEAFLTQKRIAVADVSRKKGTGNVILTALRKRGYEVFAVNPHAQEIDGETCYPDLAAIPGGVDGVVIATRPAAAEQIVRQCSEAGVGRVWMHHNALFGARSSSVSEAAVDYGRGHGIEVIAGGCPQMFGETADLGHRCMRWLLGITGKLR